jgi:hypothetical protein
MFILHPCYPASAGGSGREVKVCSDSEDISTVGIICVEIKDDQCILGFI